MKWVNILIMVLVLTSLATAAEDVSMYVQLGLKDDKVTVEEVGLSEGIGVNFDFEDTSYSAIVSSLSEKKSVVNFYFPSFIFVDSLDSESEIESGSMFLEETSQLLYFPYYRDVDKLEIYDSERKLVLSYDLSDYRVCDMDGFCFGDENIDVCPEDCKEEKPEIEEVAKKIKEEKPAEDDVTRRKGMLLLIFVGIGILAVILVALLRKKRNNK